VLRAPSAYTQLPSRGRRECVTTRCAGVAGRSAARQPARRAAALAGRTALAAALHVTGRLRAQPSAPSAHLPLQNRLRRNVWASRGTGARLAQGSAGRAAVAALWCPALPRAAAPLFAARVPPVPRANRGGVDGQPAAPEATATATARPALRAGRGDASPVGIPHRRALCHVRARPLRAGSRCPFRTALTHAKASTMGECRREITRDLRTTSVSGVRRADLSGRQANVFPALHRGDAAPRSGNSTAPGRPAGSTHRGKGAPSRADPATGRTSEATQETPQETRQEALGAIAAGTVSPKHVRFAGRAQRAHGQRAAPRVRPDERRRQQGRG
jgi:hypothetical protein